MRVRWQFWRQPLPNPRLPRRLPLRLVLTAPFIAQIVLIVGVVGYVAFRNGKAATNALLVEMGQNTLATVESHLTYYLSTPQAVNQVTQTLITNDLLPINDPDRLSQYFWHQLADHESLRFIYLGTAQGGYIGATRESATSLGPAGSLTVDMTPTLGSGQIHTYQTDAQGHATQLLNVIEAPYDARQRPWFQAAVAQRQPSWSEVFPSFYDPILGIAAYYPIYDDRQALLGVLGAEVDLDELGHFLSGLDLGPSGSVYLLEPEGLIVAASDQTALFTPSAAPGELTRLRADESESPLLRAIAQHLYPPPPPYAPRSDLTPVPLTQPITFALQSTGQTYLVSVHPLDTLPLDWWIVVALAEDDFLRDRQARSFYTVALCILIVLLSLWLTLMMARWISQPITRLHQAAQAIAQEHFDLPPVTTPIQELAELSQVFSHMAADLHTSMDDLRDRFQAAFEAAGVGMALLSLEGEILQVNAALAQMLGYTVAELKNLTVQAVTHPDDWRIDAQLKAQLRDGHIQSYSLEKRYYHQQGHIVWGLLNAALVRNQAAQASYLIAQVQDITRRKMTEQALHESNTRLQAWADTVPGHIYSLRMQPDGSHQIE